MPGHGCLCGNFKRDSAGASHSIPAEMLLWDLTLPFVRAGNLFKLGWLGSTGVLGLHRRHLAPHWDCMMCSLSPNAASFSHLYSSKMPAHNPARDSLQTWVLQTSIKSLGERLGTWPLLSHQAALRNVSSSCEGHFSQRHLCWVSAGWLLLCPSWLWVMHGDNVLATILHQRGKQKWSNT